GREDHVVRLHEGVHSRAEFVEQIPVTCETGERCAVRFQLCEPLVEQRMRARASHLGEEMTESVATVGPNHHHLEVIASIDAGGPGFLDECAVCGQGSTGFANCSGGLRACGGYSVVHEERDA